MKIRYTGIKSVDEQTAHEIRYLAGKIARQVEKTNHPDHADQEMRVQVKEVDRAYTLEALEFKTKKGDKVLEIKLFFKYGPFFFWNEPGLKYIESQGFKAFTHGYVKYFPRWN